MEQTYGQPDLLQTFLEVSETQTKEPYFSKSTNEITRTHVSIPAPSEQDTNIALPHLSVGIRKDLSSELHYEIESVLGQGGMGKVCRATQKSIDRDVALKELHQGAQNSNAAIRLIHEGRTTGQLEHPNIIPVHDLGRTSQDAPVLIMKRVQGVTWSTLLRDQGHPFWKNVKTNRLAWNLNVLIQICNAVEFAHSKNIIHRDIKPENVMLGEYGEVYLLDWGLGFDWTKPIENHVPRAAGTPAYMAPEMLHDIVHIDPSTDVYLLGATLFEIIEGRAPHRGGSLSQTLQNIVNGVEDVFEVNQYEKLTDICKRAMAYKKADRIQSANRLREELKEFLQSLSSVEILNETTERLREFNAKASAVLESEGELGPDVVQDLSKLFFECKFGFELALKQWQQNDKAKDGLDELIRTKVKVEIRRNALGSAEIFLAQMNKEDLQLRAQLVDLQNKERETKQRSEKHADLAYHEDMSIGSSARSNLVKMAIWVGVFIQGIAAYKITQSDTLVTSQELLNYALIMLVPLSVGIYLFRRTLWSNRRSSKLTSVIIGFFLLIVLTRLVAVTMDLDARTITHYEFMMATGYFLVFALTFNWWGIFCGISGLIALVAVILYPDSFAVIHRIHLIGVIFMAYAVVTKEAQADSSQE